MSQTARFMPKEQNMRNFTAPYAYREFPKWVKLADGTPLLVHDADEEAAAVGPQETTEVGGEDRDALVAEAKALGLNPHPRHGITKLREMIAAARGVEPE